MQGHWVKTLLQLAEHMQGSSALSKGSWEEL